MFTCSKQKRIRVYERDQYRCWYCGKRLLKESGPESMNQIHVSDLLLRPTLDHLVPRIKGGYDIDENLVTACRKCNSRKGKKAVEEYRSYLVLRQRRVGLDTAAWLRNEAVGIVFWGERNKERRAA